MSNLGPQQQNQTYPGLLQVDGGISSTLKPVQDGDGNFSALWLSSQEAQIAGINSTSILQIPGGITTSLQTVKDGNGNPTGLSLSSSGASVTTSDTFVPSINGAQIPDAVPRLISDGFGDYVSVKDFGAVGDGTTDDTTAIQNAVLYMASMGVDSGYGYGRGSIPALYFPSGIYLITQVNALSAGFSGTPVYSGIRFIGSGKHSTIIKYNNSSVASNNYLASFSNVNTVSFENLTINSVQATSKIINWAGGAGPAGTGFQFIDSEFSGNFSVFFDATGSALGSDTYWQNTYGTIPNNGIFFQSTNPQSVNHCFVNPVLSVGPNGTVFNISAGGNIKWSDGYTSFLGNGFVFISAKGDGSNIGASNLDILFTGWHPECSGSSWSGKIVDCDSIASITFRNCNFYQLLASSPTVSNVFNVGNSTSQRGGEIIFDRCYYPNLPAKYSGGVTGIYKDCWIDRDWQSYMTLSASSVFNTLFPYIKIVDCNSVSDSGTFPVDPVNCTPYSLQGPNGASVDTSNLQTYSPIKNAWVARQGNQPQSPGLIVGFNSTYQSFSFKVPLGCVITKVTFSYTANYPGITGDRTYKVTNFDGSVAFISPTTFTYNTKTNLFSGDLFYSVDSEAKRQIFISGYTTTLSGSTLTADYGYVLVEYI